jgi:hypothetical protein
MQGSIDAVLTAIIMLCAVLILVEAFRRWYKVLVKKEFLVEGEVVSGKDDKFCPPEFGCC